MQTGFVEVRQVAETCMILTARVWSCTGNSESPIDADGSRTVRSVVELKEDAGRRIDRSEAGSSRRGVESPGDECLGPRTSFRLSALMQLEREPGRVVSAFWNTSFCTPGP
jgi:hypothetical protein